MSNRLLTALLLVQSLALTLLVAERLMPVAHATTATRCEITNWPGSLTGTGFDTVRVRIEEVRQPVPVQVKDWDTSDRVKVSVEDWNATDRVRIEP